MTRPIVALAGTVNDWDSRALVTASTSLVARRGERGLMAREIWLRLAALLAVNVGYLPNRSRTPA
jgi:hypothetical protein